MGRTGWERGSRAAGARRDPAAARGERRRPAAPREAEAARVSGAPPAGTPPDGPGALRPDLTDDGARQRDLCSVDRPARGVVARPRSLFRALVTVDSARPDRRGPFKGF